MLPELTIALTIPIAGKLTLAAEARCVGCAISFPIDFTALIITVVPIYTIIIPQKCI